jgi:hypothetical protein
MTPELARRVRELRVDGGYTWRGLSDEIFKHPEGAVLTDWIEMKGDQPLGIVLCEAAAACLGEDVHEEPWN